MTNTWQADLDERIARDLPQLVAVRHDLHAHPQLAYEETHASAVVQRELTQLGIPFTAGLATTGVVAWIMPGDPVAAARPAVALRADMDALPIAERTALPYAAGPEFHGRMHACGHDGHTTILLGVARTLVQLQHHLPQPVKLIFQPAEEVGAGADAMIRDGALDTRTGGMPVASVFGLHNWPRLALGHCAIAVGPILAGTDLFTIDVTGRGGHAAMPHTLHDPVVAAASLVTALQTIVSRNVAATDTAVLSVTMFHAGDAPNVTPATAQLRGTVRYFLPHVQQRIHTRLRELAAGIAQAFNCNAAVHIERGYPPTVNDPAAARRIRAAAIGVGLTPQPDILPVTVAEDFAYYGRHVPAAFILLGSGNTSRPAASDLHTATYDFNDQLIPIATRLLTTIAMQPATAPTESPSDRAS